MARINVDRLNQYVNSVGSSRLACRVSTNSRITVSISVRRFKWRGQWPVLSTHSLSFVTIPSSSPVHFQVTLLMSIGFNFIGEEANKKKERVLLYVLKLSFLFLFTTFSIQNFCNIRAVSMARPTTGNVALTIFRSLYINHVLFKKKNKQKSWLRFCAAINWLTFAILGFYQINYLCAFSFSSLAEYGGRRTGGQPHESRSQSGPLLVTNYTLLWLGTLRDKTWTNGLLLLCDARFSFPKEKLVLAFLFFFFYRWWSEWIHGRHQPRDAAG